ncbi:pyridine nucleotide-disulfide oxidoreductase [Streptomyces misionensis]|uniref:Pyridine nucleotide-disulfide oxidoreductase n=1 Tax=Streptomyces misionensis TaxID=67331 RepID=A0A5C6IW00_9ACTN|nr:pyridine nucleotide-disulfide oxidoreductase [Streptomyces misionensis]TWV32712.1 pyridine nucleotide-disulfide oxidoreductase [Streptomyces misionensis]
MLAAAAVKDSVDAVEIIEAHELPAGPEPRTGVPQAAHVHPLLSGGADAIEALLPGTIGRLVAAGANRVPMTTNMVYLSAEGWYRRWRRDTRYLIAAGRDLTDHVVRRQVLDDPRVRVRAHCRAVGLLGGPGRVTGVRLRAADGTETELAADLVVDASGRATRTPRWLAGLGVTGLAEDRIESGLAYASRIYRAPVATDGWPVVNILADPRRPGGAGSIVPIEGDRWHVSLYGPPGCRPTADPDAFETYARGLRHPLVAELLARAEPLTGVTVTRTTTNRRHYYERLRNWPEGLVALGDSVAAFNPIYGQGMSVAAQGALALRELAAGGLTDGLARRAQRAIARPVDVAWSLAVGQDLHHPTTQGRRPNLGDRLLHRYVSRLSYTAIGSFRVATALTEVLTLKAPPTVLVRPDVLLAAALGPRRPPTDGPTFTPDERRRLEGAGVPLT